MSSTIDLQCSIFNRNPFYRLKMLCLYLLGHNCLHLAFEPYLKSETYSCKYEKLPNIVFHACKKYYRKSIFVENVLPANLALFIYVSTHCVETVKWLDYNRYSQLTRCCSGNASALGARGPEFNPRLRQGFLCLNFCFVIVVFLPFLFKNTLFITKVCNFFCNVNLFSILNILQDLWPIIRV